MQTAVAETQSSIDTVGADTRRSTGPAGDKLEDQPACPLCNSHTMTVKARKLPRVEVTSYSSKLHSVAGSSKQHRNQVGRETIHEENSLFVEREIEIRLLALRLGGREVYNLFLESKPPAVSG